MSLGANPLVPKDGSLEFTDATPTTPLTYVLQYEDGDVAFSEISKDQKDIQIFLSRGRFYAARETDDMPVEVTFTCHAVGFTDETDENILDIVRRAGAWAAAVNQLPASAGGGANGVWCVQLKWTGERTNFGGSADASVTMKYVHLTAAFAEGTPGKFTIKGILLPYSTDYLDWT